MQNTYMPYARIIAVFSLALLLVGGYFLWFHKNPGTPSNIVATTTEMTSGISQVATSSTGATLTTTGDGAYTVNIVPAEDRPAAPNYNKPLASDLSAADSVRADIQGRFVTIKSELKADPLDFNAWLSLASLRLITGDEQGAKEIWEYVSKVWPTNEVSFNNLGDYYANYQKDFAKSEANYLISLKNKPSNATIYTNLFNLYYVLGYSKAKAEGILKQGIAAVPKAVDMQVLLARYYRDTGRTAEAKAEYNLAISNARSQGQTALATSIQTELSAI